jgi:carotenoid 1,2-hydratase
VFSPYYAVARRNGAGDPHNHVALNVALYGRRARRWTMTERGASALSRSRDELVIGPSRLNWTGEALQIDIREIGMPIPRKVIGQVRVLPLALNPHAYAIDGHGHHIWRPIAPLARIEVALTSPSLSWSGRGYFDWNSGSAPLERDFLSWTWSRSSESARTRICYDVIRADGVRGTLDADFRTDGTAIHRAPMPLKTLQRSPVWRIPRWTRSQHDDEPVIDSTLEDTPFYARSIIQSDFDGKTIPSVHESLDLNRFRRGIVQLMLPFRMPRRTSPA